MNGLSELNTFGSQTVTVTDSRKARIVFESQRSQKDSEISFANGVFTFRITKDLYPFEIQEIINYQTCLPKLYITIKPSTITGSTFTQSLVTPVTSANPTSNLEYELSGYTNHVDWYNNLEFTWNLPSNLSSLKLLFLTFRLVWLDEATGINKEIMWDVYDLDHYYTAAFESMFNLESDSIRIRTAESNLVSKFATGAIQGSADLSTAAVITCNAGVIKNAQAAFNSNFTTAATFTYVFGGIVNLTAKAIAQGIPNRTYFNVRVSAYTDHLQLNWSVKVPTGQTWTINYGDSTTATYTGNRTITKTYSTPGFYNITIKDTSNDAIKASIKSNDTTKSSSVKITNIYSWGDVEPTNSYYDWTNFCAYEQELVSIPEYEPTDNLTSFFKYCLLLNPSNIEYWYAVTPLTAVKEAFKGCSVFNQPVNHWNVSNVTDMTSMFEGAAVFNQPLDNWNVSNVRNMSFMLFATQFNQNINNWDVSNVRDMNSMFASNDYFNQPLNNWNVSNVIDMSYMFNGTTAFNQNINNWNVSNVSNMQWMFRDAKSFNQPLNNWNVSKVTDMRYMFADTNNFNQSLNTWNVSNVRGMAGMFQNAIVFNQPLNNWNTAKVDATYGSEPTGGAGMNNMFNNASTFDQNISNWSVVLIPTKPTGFDTNTLASWTLAEKPNWGY